MGEILIRRNGLYVDDADGRQERTYEEIDLGGYIPMWFYPDLEDEQSWDHSATYPATTRFSCKQGHDEVSWRARVRYMKSDDPKTPGVQVAHPDDHGCWYCGTPVKNAIVETVQFMQVQKLDTAVLAETEAEDEDVA